MKGRPSRSGPESAQLARELSKSNLRVTSQRERVYRILREQADHPTADEVYVRVNAERHDMSLATVYNSLDALVRCGLVKQVNVDRTATRYCSNREEHCHFYCEECGRVHDIEIVGDPDDFPVRIPEDLDAHRIELSIRGTCRDPRNCNRKSISPLTSGESNS